MKSGIKAFLLVAVLCLATGCTYDFSEDYYRDIDLQEPSVHIRLTGFTDGEETRSSKPVQYEITGVGDRDFEVIVNVDGAEIHRGQQTEGEFYLALEDLTDGAHKLTFEYIFPSNSGSLVDSLGGEFFIGAAEYGFSVDKSLAKSFGIASVTLREGSIYISLNPIEDQNFDEAFLLIRNEDGYIIEQRPISQEDLADLEIHDDQSLIYNPSYAIMLRNAFYEDTSDYILLPTPKMTFSVEPVSNRYYKLIYSAHPLYGNFHTLRVEYYNYLSGNSSYIIDAKGGESEIQDELFFAAKMSLNLKFFKDDTFIGNTWEYVQVGESLPVSQFEEITYVPSMDKYFIVDLVPSNEIYVHQMNSKSYEIEKSQVIATLGSVGDLKSIEVDPSSNDLILNTKGKAFVFDFETFTAAKVYKAVDYHSEKANAVVFYRGNFVILEDISAMGEVLIYERITRNLKFRINKTSNFYSAVDASFFYVNRALYKLDGEDFTFVKVLQDQYGRDAPPLEHMAFDIRSNSAVFTWYRTAYYLDLSSLTQTYLWDMGDVYKVNYTADGRPFLNSYHFSAGTKSQLYDPASNETRSIQTNGKNPYRYFNGVVFSLNGFYLESELYTD